MACKCGKKDGHPERVCRFKQVDLNKASRPQAHNVQIQQVNEDKSEQSLDNGEAENEEVYNQASIYSRKVSSSTGERL